MELNEGEREFYRALLERSKAVYRGLEVAAPALLPPTFTIIIIVIVLLCRPLHLHAPLALSSP